MDPTLQGSCGVSQPCQRKVLNTARLIHAPSVRLSSFLRASVWRRSRSAEMEAVAFGRDAAPIVSRPAGTSGGRSGDSAGFESGPWTRQASWSGGIRHGLPAQGREDVDPRSITVGDDWAASSPDGVGPPGSRGVVIRSSRYGPRSSRRGPSVGPAVRRTFGKFGPVSRRISIVAPIPRSGRTLRGNGTTRTFERAPGLGDHCGFRNSRHQGVPVHPGSRVSDRGAASIGSVAIGTGRSPGTAVLIARSITGATVWIRPPRSGPAPGIIPVLDEAHVPVGVNVNRFGFVALPSWEGGNLGASAREAGSQLVWQQKKGDAGPGVAGDLLTGGAGRVRN